MELIMENTENTIVTQELQKIATKRVKKIRNFFIHALVYSIGLVVYILNRYFGFSIDFFPLDYLNFYVMAIWTFVFITDGIDLFLVEIVFGKKWENLKVKKMMDEDKEKNKWE